MNDKNLGILGAVIGFLWNGAKGDKSWADYLFGLGGSILISTCALMFIFIILSQHKN